MSGTAYLLPVLSDNGLHDIASKLLLQDTFPSWGFMADNNGATSIWEHWNSWTQEKGFQSSINGLGLISVGSWLFKYVGGIDTDEQEIGFKKIIFKPYIAPGIEHNNVQFYSNLGAVANHWMVSNGVFRIEVKTTLLYVILFKRTY